MTASYEGMGAGAEMDLLVATKVMAYRPFDPTRNKIDQSEYINGRGRAISHWGLAEGYDAHEEVYFRPSALIAHAWEVVERMKALGYCVTMEHGGYEKWWVRFSTLAASADDGDRSVEAAICRAALQALA